MSAASRLTSSLTDTSSSWKCSVIDEASPAQKEKPNVNQKMKCIEMKREMHEVLPRRDASGNVTIWTVGDSLRPSTDTATDEARPKDKLVEAPSMDSYTRYT